MCVFYYLLSCTILHFVPFRIDMRPSILALRFHDAAHHVPATGREEVFCSKTFIRVRFVVEPSLGYVVNICSTHKRWSITAPLCFPSYLVVSLCLTHKSLFIFPLKAFNLCLRACRNVRWWWCYLCIHDMLVQLCSWGKKYWMQTDLQLPVSLDFPWNINFWPPRYTFIFLSIISS